MNATLKYHKTNGEFTTAKFLKIFLLFKANILI